MKQETKQVLTAVIAYGSWLVAVVLTLLRSTESIPAELSMIIVLVIGVAMAAGIKLSRMRLTATMLAVFRAGVDAAREQEAERQERDRA